MIECEWRVHTLTRGVNGGETLTKTLRLTVAGLCERAISVGFAVEVVLRVAHEEYVTRDALRA